MWHTPDDFCPTLTSVDQRCTEEAIHDLMEPFLGQDAPPIPPLARDAHITYLKRLLEPLPAPYVTFDANRAWMLYWVAHALDLLRAPLRGSLQARAISTLMHFQSRDGGFGGGPGQIGHLMSTYAAVCALAILGGPGTVPNALDLKTGHSVDVGRGAWDAIDRERMYAWMLRLKQPDGSFLVHENGETDVRATYCVVAVSMLLGIATDELLDKTGAHLRSCQTYEGGFAALSTPSYAVQGTKVVPALDPASQVAQGEAHGGYAFCALASHAQLHLVGKAHDGVDVDALVRWATSLQGSIAYEGGGFRGRTNKLVDGCYGWFCGGGLMTVLEMLTDRSRQPHTCASERVRATSQDLVPSPRSPRSPRSPPRICATSPVASPLSSSSWSTETDVASSSAITLLHRDALRTYIQVVAQVPRGGLRDKPGKRPDAYHTCYNLCGLSMCEHRLRWSAEAASRAEQVYDAQVLPGMKQDSPGLDASHRACFVQSLAWSDSIASTTTERPSVEATHPIYNVGLAHVARMMTHMYKTSASLELGIGAPT